MVESGTPDALSQGRPVEIRWGTGRLEDSPQPQQSMYCVVSVNNAFNSPDATGRSRWVAHPAPQVTFRFHHGATGDFLYAESISSPRKYPFAGMVSLGNASRRKAVPSSRSRYCALPSGWRGE
jgi:hypothetical protein